LQENSKDQPFYVHEEKDEEKEREEKNESMEEVAH
jgi:hypothetical protein